MVGVDASPAGRGNLQHKCCHVQLVGVFVAGTIGEDPAPRLRGDQSTSVRLQLTILKCSLYLELRSVLSFLSMLYRPRQSQGRTTAAHPEPQLDSSYMGLRLSYVHSGEVCKAAGQT